VDINLQIVHLVKILTTPSSPDLTLQQRIEEIRSQIIEVANDGQLKKMIKEYI
jgi:hypothetical protein